MNRSGECCVRKQRDTGRVSSPSVRLVSWVVAIPLQRSHLTLPTEGVLERLYNVEKRERPRRPNSQLSTNERKTQAGPKQTQPTQIIVPKMVDFPMSCANIYQINSTNTFKPESLRPIEICPYILVLVLHQFAETKGAPNLPQTTTTTAQKIRRKYWCKVKQAEHNVGLKEDKILSNVKPLISCTEKLGKNICMNTHV